VYVGTLSQHTAPYVNSCLQSRCTFHFEAATSPAPVASRQTSPYSNPLALKRTKKAAAGRALSSRSVAAPKRPTAGDASREQAKQETRRALIAAALAEFTQHGFDAPSLDTICARAGYTRGAFYVHFADRDALIVAAMESVLRDTLDVILAAEATTDGSDLEATVLRFASALVEGNPITGESGSMQTHRLLEVCARSTEIRERLLEILAEAQGRLMNATEAAQTAGAIRPDSDPRSLASILVALALGVIQMFELGVPVDLDTMRTTVLALLAKPSSS
jgi:TetR/AcrR family transcriptional repressor of nem operon